MGDIVDIRNRRTYEVSEAARMAGVNPQSARRWLGFKPNARAVVARGDDSPPDYASFLDFVELWILRGLMLQTKLPTRRLFKLVREAQEQQGVDHALARKEFVMHGDVLFTSLPDGLLQLGAGGQMAIGKGALPGAKIIVFDASGLASALKPNRFVSIDPAVGYGAPLVSGRRLQTYLLHEQWEQGGRTTGAVTQIMNSYGLSRAQVKGAIDYEEVIRARRAA